MTADQVFAKATETGTELQSNPHRRRPRPAPALARLLAAADAPLQGSAAARAALALHRRRDRIHGQAPSSVVPATSSRRSRTPGSITSTAAPPRSSAKRPRAQDLPEQSLGRELARDSRGAAPSGRRQQRNDALRAHRVARRPRRSSDAAARIAGALAGLQRVHSAGVPSRRQRAFVLRLDDRPRRHSHVRRRAADARTTSITSKPTG